MIYCVEDDASIRELIVYTLQNTGFEAKGFETGAALFDALHALKPRLVLLDIMLPSEDGISILRRIKAEEPGLPVIMVTAKGTEYDKVIGLDCGADDYVAKPFGMMELISRIKAVLRRCDPKESVRELQVGNLVMNREKHSVTVDGRPVTLTLKEFELLRLMMENPGTVMTRDRLLTAIWGYGFDGETRTVDVHIRTLRQKLGENAEPIETVRGVGYRIGGNT